MAKTFASYIKNTSTVTWGCAHTSLDIIVDKDRCARQHSGSHLFKKQKWFNAHRQKQKVTTAPGLNISCAFANCATAIQLFPAITKISAIMVSQPRPVTNYNSL